MTRNEPAPVGDDGESEALPEFLAEDKDKPYKQVKNESQTTNAE